MEKDTTFPTRLREAESLFAGGDPDAAEHAFRTLSAEIPSLSPTRVLALSGLGCSLHALSRLEEAENAFGEALALLRQTFGADHPHVAGGLQNLARLRAERGAVKDAVALGQEALDILLHSCDADDPRVAGARLNLSSHQYAAEDFDAAEANLCAAMDIWERGAGPRSLEVSTCLNNLGRLYERRGDARTGVSFHRRAVEIRREILGDHPETAFSLGNLGAALAGDGHWQEAAATLEAALACHEHLGQAHGEEAAICRANLALCREALAETEST